MKQAIILAGGKGTRLKERLGDLPKPMIPVGGKPFEYKPAGNGFELVSAYVFRNDVAKVTVVPPASGKSPAK